MDESYGGKVAGSSYPDARSRDAQQNSRADISNKPPRPVGGVQHQLMQLNKQVGRMEESLGSLHGRLEPVMAPSGPSTGAGGSETERAPSSPLECEIANVRNRLAQLTEIINLITSRIEL